jgi:hypothetical protein
MAGAMKCASLSPCHPQRITSSYCPLNQGQARVLPTRWRLPKLSQCLHPTYLAPGKCLPVPSVVPTLPPPQAVPPRDVLLRTALPFHPAMLDPN